MLLFNNPIFSTFLPQILMFVGYMMCLIVPSFSQKAEAPQIISEEKIIVQCLTSASSTHVSVCSFSVDKDEIVENHDFTIRYFVKSKDRINIPYIGHRLSEAFLSRLYSRPPPVSLFV